MTAHHCVKDHPANHIMKDHYMSKSQHVTRNHLPRILGLSASPVMKAKVSGADLQSVYISSGLYRDLTVLGR